MFISNFFAQGYDSISVTALQYTLQLNIKITYYNISQLQYININRKLNRKEKTKS